MTSEPSVQVSMTRTATSHRFTSWDGAELFYRAWVPRNAKQEAIVLFHRGHEHSGRWQDTVDGLNLPDVPMFAWDCRGHGNSPGERGYAPGLAAVVRDMDCFINWIRDHHGIPIEKMTIVAHSVGAVVASTWVHDYAPPIRALVLATPAFRVRLYVPFAIPLLRLKEWLFGEGYVRSYIKARMITHDKDEAERYTNDPMVFPQIAVNMLLDLFDTSQRIVEDAGAIHVPTMVITAASDWVVDNGIQRRFFDRLSSKVKRFESMPGMFHAVFHESERRSLWEKIRAFYTDPEIEPVNRTKLLEADKRGYTYEEFERLRAPGPIRFTILAWLIATAGRLSRGIRLGLKRGFDSGVMLDYVYRNRAQGFTFFGWLIDKIFLEAIGWRGIRIRKTHLESLLQWAATQLHQDGRRVHIVDVAAGGGRYLLETIKRLDDIPITARLRDYKTVNVEHATRLARDLRLDGVIVERADAFDQAQVAAMTPKPTIGIVSGLYELIPVNRMLMRSLRGLFEAIEPGGFLIYTNQPWHPQLELIARSLGNREKQPWIMRRRTTAEIDALVAEAGFVKVGELIDRWGIFSVSIARRP
jgi:alpha-beta hydrolase superfamily lysophospholipase